MVRLDAVSAGSNRNCQKLRETLIATFGRCCAALVRSQRYPPNICVDFTTGLDTIHPLCSNCPRLHMDSRSAPLCQDPLEVFQASAAVTSLLGKSMITSALLTMAFGMWSKLITGISLTGMKFRNVHCPHYSSCLRPIVGVSRMPSRVNS